MPIPQQVNDRIKEAPAVMLRAVFAGVGQLLLAADKVRARASGTGWPHDRTASKGGTAGLAERQTRVQARWHTLDDNRSATVPLARERTDAQYRPAQRPVPGSSVAGGPGGVSASAAPVATAKAPVRPASAADKPVTLAEPAAPPTFPEPAADAAPTASVEPATEPEQTAQAGPDTDAPPLPGYDDLSLASLRARLRGFDAATLRTLLEYEKAHAHRDDVITLFERRLEKITAE